MQEYNSDTILVNNSVLSPLQKEVVFGSASLYVCLSVCLWTALIKKV